KIALALLFLLSVACEDDKKRAATPAPSSAPVPSAVPSLLAAPAPSATAKPEKKKIECAAGNDVTFSDKALEDEVRRKLNKPTGTITKADLAQVKSVNLPRGPVNDLDPCVYPFLTGMKDLYLSAGELDDLSALSGLTGLMTLVVASTQVKDLH